MISDEVKAYIKEKFSKIKTPIRVCYNYPSNYKYKNLIEELIKLISSNKVKVIRIGRVYDLSPFFLIKGLQEKDIKFFGLPIGHEFSVFIDALIYCATGNVPLTKSIINEVKSINEYVKVEIFVTPTCPYCSRVSKAFIMYSIVNSNIDVNIINLVDFPELAEKYEIYAVPKVFINGIPAFEGALPHKLIVKRIKEVIKH